MCIASSDMTFEVIVPKEIFQKQFSLIMKNW